LQYIEDSSVLQKIHQAICDKKYVLVHCHAGSQRSCANDLRDSFVVSRYLTPRLQLRFRLGFHWWHAI
jgi:predicted protein tyrosine phosphatase